MLTLKQQEIPMKRIIFLLFILVFFSSLTAQILSGRVLDHYSGEPIEAAMIIVDHGQQGRQDTVYSDGDGAWFHDLASSVSDLSPRQPFSFAVSQNYPNPFNPSTVIPFQIARAGQVTIQVFNVLGHMISERSADLQPGNYSVRYSSQGPAGIYFYRIQSGQQVITKKMIQLDGGGNGGLSALSHMVSGSLPTLSKTAVQSIRIMTSSFGYVRDTLTIDEIPAQTVEILLQTIHSHALVVDLHNDILEKVAVTPSYQLGDRHLYFHTDIPRLQEGGVDVQFFAVWVDPSQYPHTPFAVAMSYIDLLYDQAERNPETLALATTPAGVLSAVQQQKIAAVIGVEGGHAIEEDLDNLIRLYDAGMRYMTITWNNSTPWAISAQDRASHIIGLSDFGKTVIRTMDSLGVIIDVSHTGIKTIEDILATTQHPIVATHSGARALHNHYRNLRDDQIIAIANTGGVIGVVFYPPFLTKSYQNAGIREVIDHIQYIVDLVGIDHVALGSDFDGISRVPIGLEDVSDFPDLTWALLKEGYSQQEVEKILGGNFMRVFEQVCGK
ncbi:T9SS type A sorting domain-containing protein [candidate division KSB1 bacterium]|nr:T9SS type A sorting domain-containing protein [candidate division KSB1 bacterium]